MAHLKREALSLWVRLSACLVLFLVCCGDSDPGVEPLGAWRSMTGEGGPAAGLHHTAVLAGREVVVWGGLGGCSAQGACGTGARFNPETEVWASLSDVQAPAARYLHTAVWTGSRMLVWGGVGCGSQANTPCGDGAAYAPDTNSWTPLAATGAPSARGWHGAAWTGSQMLVWGGEEPRGAAVLGDGARYTPETNRWAPMATAGAPSARRYHAVAWTGSELLVWGGSGGARSDVALGDGAAWSPETDTWRPLSGVGTPSARWAHTAVWTGREFIVWGGLGCGRDGSGQPKLCGDGARYDPAVDRWAPMSGENAPTPRSGHTAVWTGREMLVWGGAAAKCADGTSGACRDGAAYDPDTDTWTPLSAVRAPAGRASHAAVWTGQAMFVWGGVGAGSEVTLLDGAMFTP